MKVLHPLKRETLSEANQTIFDALNSKLGFVPNLYATFAHSNVALKANLDFGNTLKSGVFTAQEFEVIALAIAKANACNYCIAAHKAVGKMVGLSEEIINEALNNQVSDVKLNILANLAVEITISRGKPKEESIQQFFNNGFGKGALVELIGLVALNTFNNYLNHIADTEIDF